MKKMLAAITLVFVLGAFCWAATEYPVSTQVVCGDTASVLWTGDTSLPAPPASLIFQNHTSGVTVYIAPISNLTTSTAGIMLTTGGVIILERSAEKWYCITSADSATVGVTVRK